MELENLKNSEQIYRLVFEKSPIGLFFYDRELRITDFNDKFLEILNLDREKMKGFDINLIHDKRIIFTIKEPFWGRDGIYDGEYITTTSNHTAWIYLHTSPILNEKGEIIFAIGIIQDFTERRKAEESLRESEEKYKYLIENMNDAVYSVDMLGNFTYISPTIKEISGYKQSEVLGHNFMKFINPMDLPGLLVRFKNMISATGKQAPESFRIKGKDGQEIYIQTHSRLTIKNGKILGINGIMSNITERKKAEEEVKKRNEELEKLNKMMVGRELKMIEMKKKMKEAGIE